MPLKLAKDVRPGDLIFHQDYPAEVLSVHTGRPGQVLIVWGDDERERCYVPEDAPVEVVPNH